MTYYRWGFDLLDTNAVESLSWHIPGPDVAILREDVGDQPAFLYFTSQHFNDLDRPAEVTARANMLRALFDGVMFLSVGPRHRPLSLRRLRDLGTDHSLGYPEPVAGIGAFSPKMCAQPLTDIERSMVLNNYVDGALYCARSDASVQGMLLTVGRDGINWKTLYALTDTMKHNGMPLDQQWRAAGCSKKEYELFKQTANNFSVLGPDARHGETGYQPPPVPMTLDRAAELILAASNAFVRRRMVRASATLAFDRATDQARRTNLQVRAAMDGSVARMPDAGLTLTSDRGPEPVVMIDAAAMAAPEALPAKPSQKIAIALASAATGGFLWAAWRAMRRSDNRNGAR